jgi:hypothetical protein
LGVTDVRNQNHDDAGRAVNTAVLAVATARQLSQDRALLAQVAMAAIMHDVARPRALRAFTGGDHGPVVARLSEDAEDRLAAGAAAVLTALGRVNEPTVARTVITYEALWLRRRSTLGPVYKGTQEPTLHARIVALARRYNDLATPEPGMPPPLPECAVARLSQELNTPADLTVLRLLAAAVGVFPAGTVVTLSTGETAEVIEGRSPSAPYHLPRVRLIMDARGGIGAPAAEVDLAAPPRNLQGARIARVLSTEGWSKRPHDDDHAPHHPPDDSLSPQTAAQLSSEDTFRSAVSNSVTRSLGWHNVARAPSPSQPGEPRSVIPSVPLTRPPSAGGDALRVSDSIGVGSAGPDRQRSALPAAMPRAPIAHERSGEQRDVSSPTATARPPFGVDGAATNNDDVDDDVDTLVFRRDSRMPNIAHRPKRAAEPNVVPTAQGDLLRTPLVHVLVYVLDRQLSGSLVVRDPDRREHCVVFSQGASSKIRTGQPVALLGEELVAARLLQPAALKATLSAARQQHARLGDFLVRNRVLTLPVLEQALQAQVVRRLEWLAKLPGDSSYAFYLDRDLLSGWGGETPSCDPLNAILAATRAWNDHDRIISNLMRLKEKPIQLHPEASLDRLCLTAEEFSLVAALRAGKCSLLELCGNGLAPDRGISALLYMLFATRQLVIPGQQRGPMQSAVDGLSVFPTAAPPPPPRAVALDPSRASAAHSTVARQAEGNSDDGSRDSVHDASHSPASVELRASGPGFDFVEARKTGVPGSEPLPTQGLEATARGKLGTTPLIHVLTYMLDHGATGSVVIHEPEHVEHCIFFDHGCPAKVRTGRPIALLGETLVARGQLDRALLDDAVETAQEIDALLGEYLIVESLASRDAVTAALEAQVVEKVVALVNLPDDSLYRFYHGRNLLTGWATGELFAADPLNVIHAAVRQWMDRQRVRSSLQKIRRHDLVFHPDAHVSGLALSPAEREVLSRIQAGGYSLQTLHDDHLADEEEVNSIVYALAITRQFQFPKQRKAPMRPLSCLPDGPLRQVGSPSSFPLGSEPPSWNSMLVGFPSASALPGKPSPTG